MAWYGVMDSTNRGVLYIATREPYLSEATTSARSVRAHNPELPITLCAPADVVVPGVFDEAIQITNPDHGFSDSNLSSGHMIYDRTLFLDSDTYVTGSLEPVYDLLDRNDLVAAQDPTRTGTVEHGHEHGSDTERRTNDDTAAQTQRRSGPLVAGEEWPLEHAQKRGVDGPPTGASMSALERAYLTVRTRLSPPTTVRSGIDPRVSFHAWESSDVNRALTGIREEPVVEWLLSAVDRSTTFWDVGAFHGHYSILAAARGGDAIAFELAERNRERIRANARLNDVQVAVAPIGLSNHDGSVGVDYQRQSRDAELGVGFGDGERVKPGDEVGYQRPDVVKIDVEGHELAVLEGMQLTLPTVERIAIEVHEGVDVTVVRERLQSAGLTTREIDTDRSQTFIGGTRV